MSSDTTPWGLHTFSGKNEIRLEWNRLRIRILKRDRDLLLVESRGDGRAQVQLDAEPENDFRRYAFEGPVEAIRVLPRTPERPLVVQPLHPLRLAPKAKVNFYVSVPVDIQLSTGSPNSPQALERVRSEILSDTWFGDQISGVLCYAIKSRARREHQIIDSEQIARVICKIQIHNQSTEQLHCAKFCLHLDHCHMWRSGPALWTSPINIHYNGSDHFSSIDYSAEAPTEAVNPTKIADAFEEPLSGLIRRTFAGLGSSLA